MSEMRDDRFVLEDDDRFVLDDADRFVFEEETEELASAPSAPSALPDPEYADELNLEEAQGARFVPESGLGDIGTGLVEATERAGYRMGQQLGGSKQFAGELEEASARRRAAEFKVAREEGIDAALAPYLTRRGDVPASPTPIPPELLELRSLKDDPGAFNAALEKHEARIGRSIAEAEARAARGREIYESFAELYEDSASRSELTHGTFPYYMSHAAEALLGNVLPAIGVGIVTGGSGMGLTVMGGQVYSEVYGESRAEGMTREDASLRAALHAATETLTEVGPLNMTVKAGMPWLKRIAGTAGLEAIGEAINEAMQIGIDREMLDEATPLFDIKDHEGRVVEVGAISRMIDAGIVGGLLGTGMGAIGAVADIGRAGPEGPPGEEMGPPEARATPVPEPGGIERTALPPPEGLPPAGGAGAPPGGPTRFWFGDERHADEQPPAADSADAIDGGPSQEMGGISGIDEDAGFEFEPTPPPQGARPTREAGGMDMAGIEEAVRGRTTWAPDEVVEREGVLEPGAPVEWEGEGQTIGQVVRPMFEDDQLQGYLVETRRGNQVVRLDAKPRRRAPMELELTDEVSGLEAEAPAPPKPLEAEVESESQVEQRLRGIETPEPVEQDVEPDVETPEPVEQDVEPDVETEQDLRALAKSKKAKDRWAKDRLVDPSKDSLLVAIAKMGGMDRDKAIAEGVDPASTKKRGGMHGLVFRKGGDSADGLAVRLQELGYPVTNKEGNYDAELVMQAVYKELGGEKVMALSAYTDERLLEAYEADMEDYYEAKSRGEDEALLLTAEEYFDEDGEFDDTARAALDLASQGQQLGLDEDIIEEVLERGFRQELDDDAILRQLRAAAEEPAAGSAQVPSEPAEEAPPADQPSVPSTAEQVAEAAAEAATSQENDLPEPTEAQKEAGNYQKGHVALHGLDVSIENPAGSRRRPDWPELKDHYGYIKGTVGKDKDHLDVFLGPNAADESLQPWVIDQVNPKTGEFDEHKVVFGAKDEAEAREIYLRNYAPGWGGLSGATGMPWAAFRVWSKSKNQTQKRLSEEPGAPKPKIETARPAPGKVEWKNVRRGGQQMQDGTPRWEAKLPNGLTATIVNGHIKRNETKPEFYAIRIHGADFVEYDAPSIQNTIREAKDSIQRWSDANPTPPETTAQRLKRQQEEEKDLEHAQAGMEGLQKERTQRKDEVLRAVERAADAIGRERLIENRIMREGESIEDWVRRLHEQKSSWNKGGGKTGVTGLQMLSQKNLYGDNYPEGEALRKALLAAVRARRNSWFDSPKEESAWYQKVRNARAAIDAAEEAQDAKRVREDEGQVRPGRDDDDRGEAEGSSDLEQQPPGGPGGAALDTPAPVRGEGRTEGEEPLIEGFIPFEDVQAELTHIPENANALRRADLNEPPAGWRRVGPGIFLQSSSALMSRRHVLLEGPYNFVETFPSPLPGVEGAPDPSDHVAVRSFHHDIIDRYVSRLKFGRDGAGARLKLAREGVNPKTGKELKGKRRQAVIDEATAEIQRYKLDNIAAMDAYEALYGSEARQAFEAFGEKDGIIQKGGVVDLKAGNVWFDVEVDGHTVTVEWDLWFGTSLHGPSISTTGYRSVAELGMVRILDSDDLDHPPMVFTFEELKAHETELIRARHEEMRKEGKLPSAEESQLELTPVIPETKPAPRTETQTDLLGAKPALQAMHDRDLDAKRKAETAPLPHAGPGGLFRDIEEEERAKAFADQQANIPLEERFDDESSDQSEVVQGPEGPELQEEGSVQQATPPGQVVAAGERVGPDAEVLVRRFASGMSRPGDLEAALADQRPVGIALPETSKPTLDKLPDLIRANPDVEWFVDHGGFSLYREQERAKAAGQDPLVERKMDWDQVIQAYKDLVYPIAQEGPGAGNVLLAAPDVVGKQDESIDLLYGYAEDLANLFYGSESEEDFAIGAQLIVPIQRGPKRAIEAWREQRTAFFNHLAENEIDQLRIGVPTAKEAMTDEDLAELVRETGHMRWHILGGVSDSKLKARLDTIISNHPNPDQLDISADAVIIRSRTKEISEAEGTHVERVRKALERDPGYKVIRQQPVTTPGTRIQWKTLSEWIEGALDLDARKHEARTFERQESHARALIDYRDVIDNETDRSVLDQALNFRDRSRHGTRLSPEAIEAIEARIEALTREAYAGEAAQHLAGYWSEMEPVIKRIGEYTGDRNWQAGDEARAIVDVVREAYEREDVDALVQALKDLSKSLALQARSEENRNGEPMIRALANAAKSFATAMQGGGNIVYFHEPQTPEKYQSAMLPGGMFVAIRHLSGKYRAAILGAGSRELVAEQPKGEESSISAAKAWVKQQLSATKDRQVYDEFGEGPRWQHYGELASDKIQHVSTAIEGNVELYVFREKGVYEASAYREGTHVWSSEEKTSRDEAEAEAERWLSEGAPRTVRPEREEPLDKLPDDLRNLITIRPRFGAAGGPDFIALSEEGMVSTMNLAGDANFKIGQVQDILTVPAWGDKGQAAGDFSLSLNSHLIEPVQKTGTISHYKLSAAGVELLRKYRELEQRRLNRAGEILGLEQFEAPSDLDPEGPGSEESTTSEVPSGSEQVPSGSYPKDPEVTLFVIRSFAARQMSRMEDAGYDGAQLQKAIDAYIAGAEAYLAGEQAPADPFPTWHWGHSHGPSVAAELEGGQDEEIEFSRPRGGDAAARLERHGVKARPAKTRTNKDVWEISGTIFRDDPGVRQAMKDAFAKPDGRSGVSWYADKEVWTYWAADDPTGRLADAIEAELRTTRGGSDGARSTVAGSLPADLRAYREQLDQAPDERRAGIDSDRYVGEVTRGLLRRGETVGIPSWIISDQIEDVGWINRAYQEGKPLYLLASEAGTGKTFVLGGAIRELRDAGVERFIYVTQNQGLIRQIREEDLADFGLQGVEFVTYKKLQTSAPDATGAVVIFDEAHGLKDITGLQGRAGSRMMDDARFAILASATPFENPVQAAYLAATGIFDDVPGGFENWARMYGGVVRGFGTDQQILYWPGGHLEDGKAARRFFFRKAVMSHRPMHLPAGMVEAKFMRGKVKPEWTELHDTLEQAYTLALDGVNPQNPLYRDIRQHRANTLKRVLEAAKMKGVISRTQHWLDQDHSVVVFVETKADRHLGRWRMRGAKPTDPTYTFDQMSEMMAEWQMERSMAFQMGDRPPPPPFTSAIMRIAGAYESLGVDQELPSTVELVTDHFGTDQVAEYTGRITDARAKQNLAGWKSKKKPILVVTMEKGGTGLSLHDTKGDRPTVQIGANMPWSATKLDQVSARTGRYGLQTKAYIEWMFASNIPYEGDIAAKVGGKLRDMGAIVRGIEVPASTVLTGQFDFEGDLVIERLEESTEQPKFSRRRRPENPLVALHNLGESEVIAAAELGGLAVPSIAIKPAKFPHEGFGDVTLVFPPSTVDPAYEQVFEVDAYSPMFPRPRYRFTDNLRQQLSKRMRGAIRALGKLTDTYQNNPEHYRKTGWVPTPMAWESLLQDIETHERLDSMEIDNLKWMLGERKMLGALQFLMDRGVEIEVPSMKRRIEHRDFLESPEFKAWRKAGGPLSLEYEDRESRESFTGAYVAFIERHYAEHGLDDVGVRSLHSSMFDKDGLIGWGPAYRMIDRVKYLRRRQVDEDKLERILKRHLRKIGIDTYNEWVREIMKPIRNTEYLELGRQKVPYILDNIVEAMTRGRTNANGGGMTFSLGQARALGAKRFTSLAQIQRRRDEFVSTEEKEKRAEEAQKLVTDWFDTMHANYRYRRGPGEFGDVWEGNDRLSEALGRYLKGTRGRQPARLRNILEANDYIDVQNYQIEEGLDAAEALLSVPREYFEAKPQRAVTFNEAAGAVVPYGTKAQVIEALKRRGVERIRYYKKNDGAGRARAVQKFSNALFSRPADVLQRLRRVGFVTDREIMGILQARPAYLDRVMEFMLEQRRRLVAGEIQPRDLGKALAITVASQAASAINPAIVQAKTGFVVPDEFLDARGQVRPEEAMAAWLLSKDGRQALDELDSGSVNETLWRRGADVRAAWGDDRLANLGALESLKDLGDVTARVNAARGEPVAVREALRGLRGVGTGKIGFLGHLLGLGDVPTVDAVEISVWLTGKASTRFNDSARGQLARQVATMTHKAGIGQYLQDRVRARFQGLRRKHPEAADIDEAVFGHVMHHWLWDRAKGLETTHQPLYEAMVRASEPADGYDRPAVRGTASVTEDSERLRKVLDAKVGGFTKPSDLTEVPLPDLASGPVAAIAAIFGKRIVAVRNRRSDEFYFAGVTLPSSAPDVVYLEENSETPHLTILGHELVHHLRRDHPDLYDYLRSVAREEMRDPSGFYAQVTRQAAEEGREATEAHLEEELLGDFVGDAFSEPSFWRRVSERAPEIFDRLARFVIDFLDSILAKMGRVAKLGGDQYFRDVRRVREAAADVYAEWARREARETPTAPPEDAQLALFKDAKASEAPTFLGKMWDALATDPQAHRAPSSTATDPDQIRSDMAPMMDWEITVHDQDSWSIHPTSGEYQDVAILTVFDATESRPYLQIFPAKGRGSGGWLAYQIAYTWAHNNNKTMRPDPSGLSGVNLLRRAEAIISSALRHKTTRHLEPHQDQFTAVLGPDQRRLSLAQQAAGEDTEDTATREGVRALQDRQAEGRLWQEERPELARYNRETYEDNLDNLVLASTALVMRRAPAYREYHLEPDGTLFHYDESLGQWEPAESLPAPTEEQALEGVGYSTAQRAVITASALRGSPAGDADQALRLIEARFAEAGPARTVVRGAWAQFAHALERGGALPDELTGLLYSRNRSPWYSQLQRVSAELLPNKGKPAQIANDVRSWVKRGRVKGAELEASGLIPWLESQEGRLTKDQVLDFLRENQVYVETFKQLDDAEEKLDLRETDSQYVEETVWSIVEREQHGGSSILESYPDEESAREAFEGLAGEFKDAEIDLVEHILEPTEDTEVRFTYEDSYGGIWTLTGPDDLGEATLRLEQRPVLPVNANEPDWFIGPPAPEGYVISGRDERIRRDETWGAISDWYNDAVFGHASASQYGQYTLPGLMAGSYVELLVKAEKPSAEAVPAYYDIFDQSGLLLESTVHWKNLYTQLKNWGGTRYEPSKTETFKRSTWDPRFESAHFNLPNLVVHVRGGEYIPGPDEESSGRVFLANEFQSDWGQELQQHPAAAADTLEERIEAERRKDELTQIGVTWLQTLSETSGEHRFEHIESEVAAHQLPWLWERGGGASTGVYGLLDYEYGLRPGSGQIPFTTRHVVQTLTQMVGMSQPTSEWAQGADHPTGIDNYVRILTVRRDFLVDWLEKWAKDPDAPSPRGPTRGQLGDSYTTNEAIPAREEIALLNQAIEFWKPKQAEAKKLHDEILIAAARSGEAPYDMPWRNSWALLGLKEALRYSVEQGYDYLAWPSTPLQVEEIEKGGGGSGKLYTDHLPKIAAKYVKQWGGKVEKISIYADQSGVGTGSFTGNIDRQETVYAIELTDAIKEGVQAGQALFSRPAQLPQGEDVGRWVQKLDDAQLLRLHRAQLGEEGNRLLASDSGLQQAIGGHMLDRLAELQGVTTIGFELTPPLGPTEDPVEADIDVEEISEREYIEEEVLLWLGAQRISPAALRRKVFDIIRPAAGVREELPQTYPTTAIPRQEMLALPEDTTSAREVPPIQGDLLEPDLFFSRRREPPRGQHPETIYGTLPNGQHAAVAYPNGPRGEWRVSLYKNASGEAFYRGPRHSQVATRRLAVLAMETAGLTVHQGVPPIVQMEQTPLFQPGYPVAAAELEALLAAHWTDQLRAPGRSVMAWSHRARIFFQDQILPLKKQQAEILKVTGERQLDDDVDAYLAEELYHGRAASRIEEFERDEMLPLLELLKEHELSIEAVDEYLWARHAPEANRRLKDINPTREDNDRLSGMSDTEAAEAMEGFRQQGQLQALEAIARKVDAITAGTRNLIVSYGLESSQTVEGWRQQYDHYVPLFRDHGEDPRMPFARGQGYSIRGREAKHRTGSLRRVVDVMAHVVAQRESAILRGEKNRVGQTLLKLVQKHPMPDFWEVNKVEYTSTLGADGLVVQRMDPQLDTKDHILDVKVRGKVHRIWFNENDHTALRIAIGMKNLGSGQLAGPLRALGMLMRYFAMINTSFSGEFMFTNFLRDVQTAGVTMQATEAKGMQGRIIKDLRKAMVGIAVAREVPGARAGPGLGMPAATIDTWAARYREFHEEGGQTGWMDSYDTIGERQRRLEAELRQLSRSPVNPKRMFRALLDFVAEWNTVVENGVRLSTYHHLVEAGVAKARAASTAKNLTVNFNRKGEAGKTINALWLFFNASIQGTSTIIMAAAKSRVVRGILLALMMAGFLMDWLNYLMAGDDDDGENRWNKMTRTQPWLVERSWILVNPFSDRGYLAPPLPYGLNVFIVLGQTMGEASRSALGMADFAPARWGGRMLEAITNAFNPIGTDSTIAQTIMPTAGKPFVSWAQNKDWAGRPMYREDFPGQPPMPDHMRYLHSTSQMSRWVTKFIAEQTGGDDVMPGGVDMNPAMLDLIFDTFTGSAGRLVRDSALLPVEILEQMEAGEFEPRSIPFVRRVYRARSATTGLRDFYERLDVIKRAEDRVKLYKKQVAQAVQGSDQAEVANATNALARIREEHAKELSMAFFARSKRETVSRLRKKLRELEFQGRPEAWKREERKRLKKRLKDHVDLFNRRFRETVLEEAA